MCTHAEGMSHLIGSLRQMLRTFEIKSRPINEGEYQVDAVGHQIGPEVGSVCALSAAHQDALQHRASQTGCGASFSTSACAVSLGVATKRPKRAEAPSRRRRSDFQ